MCAEAQSNADRSYIKYIIILLFYIKTDIEFQTPTAKEKKLTSYVAKGCKILNEDISKFGAFGPLNVMPLVIATESIFNFLDK